ncbi:hypothetical protein SO802_008540 [Lithocarpus litseifolius]|uniref:Uncharacterized protein n=1 Tax=Lithocarpus litseifolius TaxID=425828 RepID=A0AAW2D903_9ROSI
MTENLQLLADEGEASSNSSSLPEDLIIENCPSLRCFRSNIVRNWRPGPTACRTSILFISSIVQASYTFQKRIGQSFPDEQDGKLTMTLPSSLTKLTIWRIPNIVILSSKGFQNLSALEILVIRNCPKLASLLEKGLPSSLLQLYIYECPLLKQHCKKGGQGWSKIANVPYVDIDGEVCL